MRVDGSLSFCLINAIGEGAGSKLISGCDFWA
jgi:hypothetical protein